MEYAESDALEDRRRKLHFLVDQIIAGTSLTRHDLLSALRDRYKEYKRAQLLSEARRKSVRGSTETTDALEGTRDRVRTSSRIACQSSRIALAFCSVSRKGEVWTATSKLALSTWPWSETIDK
jgi:hypothetical protein